MTASDARPPSDTGTTEKVLADHQLGFMGTCVDQEGTACGWKASKRRGDYSAQHRAHVADRIEEVMP